MTGEDLLARAGCEVSVWRRKACSGEQVSEPQQAVTPAAAADLQAARRIAFVTGTATSAEREPTIGVVCGRARGTAHPQGRVRNVRGASTRFLLGPTVPYRPMAEMRGAQWVSDGSVFRRASVKAESMNAVRHDMAAVVGLMLGTSTKQVSASAWMASRDMINPSPLIRLHKRGGSSGSLGPQPILGGKGASMSRPQPAGLMSCG